MIIESKKNFDQVVEGNINIKQLQLSKKKYKITIYKIGKFLRYQAWSSFFEPLNNDRSVYYQNAKQWIKNFSLLNESNIHFKPTTVMKIGNNNYLFVIDKAKLNNKGRVVFKVSTKEIKISGKKMLKIPCGDHDGVRFDIDGETIPPMSSITLGEPGTASSWPCCSLYPYTIDLGYTSWQFYESCNNSSSNPCVIQGLGTVETVGYLYVYMNFTKCDINKGENQGPAQIVTINSVSQINFLNNIPNTNIGTQLSKDIINFINLYNSLYTSTPPIPPITPLTAWSTVKEQLEIQLPKLIIDEPLIFINPTPLTFTQTSLSFPVVDLPLARGQSVVPIAGLITFLSSTQYLSLTNYNITNNNDCTTQLVTNDTQNSFNPYIIVIPGSNGGSFTFNATQPFFQNSTIIYLETSLTITVNITT
jgi:hypothetical protein